VNDFPTRYSKRRLVELVAVCMDHRGRAGLKLAATISTSRGLERELFDCGPTPEGLITGLREIADWVENRIHDLRADAEREQAARAALVAKAQGTPQVGLAGEGSAPQSWALPFGAFEPHSADHPPVGATDA
jgi:hypothetical protein